MKQHLLSLVAGTCISSVAFAGESDTYSNDFSNGGGTHYGTSFITTYNGHADLQLVSDGQSGTYGTWKISEFDGRHISAFNASFKFSYNTNGNGGIGDGFSFLFGDMSDMTENRWEGGEYGLNAFTDMSSGMSIGFDSYNDGNSPSGIYARWGGKDLAWTHFGPEWYEIANYGDYNQALDDYYQGTIYINWDDQTGLQVGVSWPGYDTWWGLSTGAFTGSIMDTTNYGFGFAGRNGGIDNDILIDNFNVTYTYYDDCNGNVTSDTYDIKSGNSQDCNGDGVPDECQLTDNDCNGNGTPDECETDCDSNGIPDDCDIANGSPDCNTNGIPDSCEIEVDPALDCNGGGVLDSCEIADDPALDCNGNGIPDSCETEDDPALDCNGNGIPDSCDIYYGTSEDLNNDGVPDECQCLGDIAGDGDIVNVHDVLALISHWNSSESSADIDGNGNVGISDLLILIANWGPCSTP
jgi:hypothetical protein